MICVRCGEEASTWVNHGIGKEPMDLRCSDEVSMLEYAITTIEYSFYDDDSTPIPTLNRLREMAAQRAPATTKRGCR